MNLLLFLAVSTWHVARGNVDVSETFQRQIHFSVDLYKAVASKEKGFFALAPADVFLGLSQLHNAAEGLSRQQLCNVLHYSSNCSAVAESGLHQLVTRMKDLQSVGAWMENEIFCPHQWNIESSFLGQIFSNSGKKLQRVRYWHERTGEEKLYELAKKVWIPNPHNQWFEAEESLVLASAAMFMPSLHIPNFIEKGLIHRFYNNEDLHHLCAFFISATEVDYGKLRYPRGSRGPLARAQYVGITWEPGQQSMIKTFIVLPKDLDGITDLEDNINEATIHQMLSNSTRRWVVLTLPEDSKITKTYNLIEPLEKMNLTQVFDKTNDFARITKNHPIKVGSILHQVRIQHKLLPDVASAIDPSHFNYDRMPRFTADHTFIIVTIYTGKNPFILSMARYGLVPGIQPDVKYSDENLNENRSPYPGPFSPYHTNDHPYYRNVCPCYTNVYPHYTNVHPFYWYSYPAMSYPSMTGPNGVSG